MTRAGTAKRKIARDDKALRSVERAFAQSAIARDMGRTIIRLKGERAAAYVSGQLRERDRVLGAIERALPEGSSLVDENVRSALKNLAATVVATNPETWGHADERDGSAEADSGDVPEQQLGAVGAEGVAPIGEQQAGS